MHKKLLLFTTLICLVCFTKAQQRKSLEATGSRAQSVYGELAGNGLILSANYDFRFKPKQNGLGMRIGVGYFGSNEEGFLTIPIGINHLLGQAPNFLETGLGFTYAKFTGFSSDEAAGSLLIPSIGYRYQSIGNGMVFRIGLTPLVSTAQGGGWFMYGGLSFGYKF